MTQAEVAKACGVSQGSVASWEKGITFPRPSKIGVVAFVLGCKPDDLLKMAEDREAG